MKRYFIHIIILTLILVIASFILLWSGSENYSFLIPIFVLYFAVITAIQHNVVTRSMLKDPRTFVKNFLGISVGAMMLHLVIVFAYAISQMKSANQAHNAKIVIVSFCILFVIFLAFETIELVLFVRKYKEPNSQK